MRGRKRVADFSLWSLAVTGTRGECPSASREDLRRTRLWLASILLVVVVGMILAFTVDAIFAAIIFIGLLVFGALGGVVAAVIRPRK